MRGVVVAICLVAVGVCGLCAGRRFAIVDRCLEPRAYRLDRNPSGRQSLHECHYDVQCPLAPAGATAGWCRKDTCAKCPIQSGGTQASECQNEFACKLSDAMYSLCGNECGVAATLR